MGGAFPLRVADLLFTDETLLVPEYRYLTPLFGIARSGSQSVADAAVERFRAEGVAGLLELANRTHRIGYDDVERVHLYGGRSFGRPKLAVDVASGPPYAYRIHAPVEIPRLRGALTGLGARRGFEVTYHSTLGFSPLKSVRRFLADR
jgi:hypothetical protein